MPKATEAQIVDENCLAAALHFAVIVRLKTLRVSESYLTAKLAVCTVRNAGWWAAKIDNLKFVVSDGRIGLPGTEPSRLLIQKGIALWQTNPAEAKLAIARTLRPNMEGCWVGWLIGVEPAK
jgi:hypothetical protein